MVEWCLCLWCCNAKFSLNEFYNFVGVVLCFVGVVVGLLANKPAAVILMIIVAQVATAHSLAQWWGDSTMMIVLEKYDMILVENIGPCYVWIIFYKLLEEFF